MYRLVSCMFLCVSGFICVYLMYQSVSCVYLSVRMYLYVSVFMSKYQYICMYPLCICMYCTYFPHTTRKQPPCPQNTSSRGGTRRAAPRASQGMCANTLFRNQRSTQRLYFAHPARRTRLMPLKRLSDSAGAAPRTDQRAQIRSHAPSQPISRVGVAPAARHRPPKNPPERDWRVHVSACICVYQGLA
jgi:hypothetical protein